MNSSDGDSLNIIGIKIRGLFASITRLPKKPLATNSFDLEQLQADFERFELWASNLGLNAPGHGSLDYRLRDWEIADNVIRTLLKDVRNALADVVVLLSDSIRAADGLRDAPLRNVDNERSALEEDLGSREQEDELRALGYGSEDEDVDTFAEAIAMHAHTISDALDRLYRVATKIRNPATRQVSHKVASLKQVDPESGVDLLDVYADRDYRHLLETFDRRREFAQEEHEVSVQEIDSWKSGKTHFLVTRLARANTARRKQFYQWRKHRLKLESASYVTSETPEPDTLLPGLVRPVLPSGMLLAAPSATGHSLPTTATMLNIHSINWDEDKSTVSVSEYAVNANADDDEVVEFPEPPAQKRGTKHFECHYCFTICPNAYLKSRDAWRNHLIRDLRPYVCTYDECVSSQELYASRADWIQHENASHRKLWRCLDHANATFTSKRDYEIHIQKEHSDASKYLQSPELLKAGESTRLQSDRPCPICGKEIPFALDLQYHIALHLEKLALYSLPRSTGREDDSQDASDWSDQVNGGRDSSKSELLSTSASVDSVEEVGLEQRERVEDQSRSIDNPEGTPMDQIERGVAHLDSDIKHQELTAASLSVQAKEQDHTRKVEAFLEDQVPSLDHENLLNSTTGSAQRGPFAIPWDYEEDKVLLQKTGVPEILSPGAQLPGWEELSPLREGAQAPPPPKEMEFPESHRLLRPTPRNLQLICGHELGVQLTLEIAEGICALCKVDNGTDAERQEAFENAFNFTKDWSDLFHRLSQKARDDDQEYLDILDFSKGVSRFGYRLNHTVVCTIFQSFVGRETELQQARMTFSQFVTACVWLKQSTDVFKQFDDDRDGYVTLSFEEALGSWMELGAGGAVKNDEGILGTSKQGASALRVVN